MASSVVHLAILIIVILGVIGIAYVVAQESGIGIPPFIVRIFWIVLAVVIGVVAITFISRYI
jgi:hypothetical protein